jgi:hypothetical protein
MEGFFMEMEVWRPYWTKLVEKCEKVSYENLTEEERIWYNLRNLIDSVGNGGLISFYYNYGADHLKETMDDLGKLKAEKVVKMLNKINDLFPNSQPSKDIDKRNEVINTWEDEKTNNMLEKLDDKFYEFEEKLEEKLEPIIKKVISNGVNF